jgi:protein-L-isoaspartate(D-aspartate) O-methyltransferase
VHRGIKVFRGKKPADYDEARAWMVQEQIVARGVCDERVIEAVREVPRHLFVPEARRPQAYDDRPLPIGYGQTISQPFIVAFMTAALALTGEEKVLEVGAGSGYQAAILSRLAQQVISIECIRELADSASARLAELGYDNVRVAFGDGSAGLPDEAPFDAIMLTAAAPEVPWPLCQQLTDNGRLVGPVGSRYDQVLVRLQRRGDEWERETLGPVIFVPLVGRHGWQDP